MNHTPFFHWEIREEEAAIRLVDDLFALARGTSSADTASSITQPRASPEGVASADLLLAASMFPACL
jgi:hypothetical protein